MENGEHGFACGERWQISGDRSARMLPPPALGASQCHLPRSTQGGRTRRTASMLWLRTLALSLSIVCSSVVRADDTPHTTCAAIAPRLIDVRGGPGLPRLTEQEHSSVAYYRKLHQYSGPLYLFWGRLPWEPASRFSLLFQSASCDGICRAAAILHAGQDVQIKYFLYRKNVVGEPYRGPATVTTNGTQERRSTSYIFLADSNNGNQIEFFDIHQLSSELPWNKDTLRRSTSIGSGASVRPSSGDAAYQNYNACLNDPSEKNGEIVTIR